MLNRTGPWFSLLFLLKPLCGGFSDSRVCVLPLPKTCGCSFVLVNGLKGSDWPPLATPLSLTSLPSCLPPSPHPLHRSALSPSSPKTRDGDSIDLCAQESSSKKCTHRPLGQARSQPFRNTVEKSLRALSRQRRLSCVTASKLFEH